MQNIQNDIELLKENFRKAFGKLSENDSRTIEFYYKMGIVRCVDGFEYVNEAINRASMKQKLSKPISYVASLCKNFYKRGLYSQPSQEENDIMEYIEKKIGSLSENNRILLLNAITSTGAVKVMASSVEVLNSSKIQDKIIEEIILKLIEMWE